jgi:hypothetical protein
MCLTSFNTHSLVPIFERKTLYITICTKSNSNLNYFQLGVNSLTIFIKNVVKKTVNLTIWRFFRYEIEDLFRQTDTAFKGDRI